VDSVALGLGLPAQWKTHRERPAKYLLRRAYREDLPEEIVNRPKQKFSKGAGSSDVIARIAEQQISDQDFHSERARLLYQWNYRLPNKEGLYYYRLLREHYEEQWIFPTIGSSRSL
jgi:asparagine synthase (glutamine-hydrolysing)